jgi:hypothetical protein
MYEIKLDRLAIYNARLFSYGTKMGQRCEATTMIFLQLHGLKTCLYLPEMQKQ